mgnify:CR=1 FL=1
MPRLPIKGDKNGVHEYRITLGTFERERLDSALTAFSINRRGDRGRTTIRRRGFRSRRTIGARPSKSRREGSRVSWRDRGHWRRLRRSNGFDRANLRYGRR